MLVSMKPSFRLVVWKVINSFRRLESRTGGGPKKKDPYRWQGSLYPDPPARLHRHQERGCYNSPPAALVSASSIAFGEHMMLKKVPPLLLATMGRCGQLMAMRKRP